MLYTSWYLLPLILVVFYTSAVFSLILPLPFIAPEALDDLKSNKKMNEFIKHLGIPNESLCQPDTDEGTDPIFHEDLEFADLLMDEEPEETEVEEDDANDVQNDFTDETSSSRKRKKKGKKPKKWTDGIVPYYISKDFDSKQKEKIEDAIEEMNFKLISVYFRPVQKSDKNYVIIFSGKGCYSNLGMKGGQQAVSLQVDKCLRKGTVQHELLHVLGFRHEQNRPDRDDYVQILYENIPKKWHKDYKRYRPSEANYIGVYDFYSVLHYPLEAPKSKGEKLAFRILDDDVDIERIGNRKMISKMDLWKAEELYSDDL